LIERQQKTTTYPIPIDLSFPVLIAIVALIFCWFSYALCVCCRSSGNVAEGVYEMAPVNDSMQGKYAPMGGMKGGDLSIMPMMSMQPVSLDDIKRM